MDQLLKYYNYENTFIIEKKINSSKNKREIGTTFGSYKYLLRDKIKNTVVIKKYQNQFIQAISIIWSINACIKKS